MCMPAFCFGVAAVRGVQVGFLGPYTFFCMHTLPLFNSLAVVLCLPSYRRQVVDLLLCRRVRGKPTRVSSLNGPSRAASSVHKETDII